MTDGDGNCGSLIVLGRDIDKYKEENSIPSEVELVIILTGSVVADHSDLDSKMIHNTLTAVQDKVGLTSMVFELDEYLRGNLVGEYDIDKDALKLYNIDVLEKEYLDIWLDFTLVHFGLDPNDKKNSA